MYGNSENIKTDRVNTVVFNLNQVKRRASFGTPGKLAFQNLKHSPLNCIIC